MLYPVVSQKPLSELHISSVSNSDIVVADTDCLNVKKLYEQHHIEGQVILLHFNSLSFDSTKMTVL